MRLMAIEQCDSYNKPRLMPDVIWLFPIKFDRNYYLLFSSLLVFSNRSDNTRFKNRFKNYRKFGYTFFKFR